MQIQSRAPSSAVPSSGFQKSQAKQSALEPTFDRMYIVAIWSPPQIMVWLSAAVDPGMMLCRPVSNRWMQPSLPWLRQYPASCRRCSKRCSIFIDVKILHSEEEPSSAGPAGQMGRSSRQSAFDIYGMAALQGPVDVHNPCHTNPSEARWALDRSCGRVCWRCSRCKHRHQITPGDTGKSTFAAKSRARSCNAARRAGVVG